MQVKPDEGTGGCNIGCTSIEEGSEDGNGVAFSGSLRVKN